MSPEPVPSKSNRVLAPGLLRRDLVIYHGKTPEQTHRRNRARWALLSALYVVPMPLRSRRPFARFFWQAWEVEKVTAHAKALADRHGWV